MNIIVKEKGHPSDRRDFHMLKSIFGVNVTILEDRINNAMNPMITDARFAIITSVRPFCKKNLRNKGNK